MEFIALEIEFFVLVALALRIFDRLDRIERAIRGEPEPRTLPPKLPIWGRLPSLSRDDSAGWLP